MGIKRPTREDVAREAGTSVAVVTYTVNNGPRPVAAETRKRVLAAIEKLGYNPNRAARVLASGKSGIYGLVLPNITNPFIAEIAHAFHARAFMRGETIMLGDSADNPHEERLLLRSLISHQVDGVIYMGTVENLALDIFTDTNTPVVVFTYADSDSRCPSVRIDETRAVYALTSHLKRHGYEDIALLTGPPGMKNSFVRAQGWCRATGKPQSSADISRGAYSRICGYEWVLEKARKGRMPRALVTGNERQALGVLAACADLGIRVPEDLAVAALNGSSDSGFTTPSLTSVRQPWEEMTRRTFEILDKARPAAQTEGTVCGFDLVVGRSCGCAHAGTDDRRVIAAWATPLAESLDSAAGIGRDLPKNERKRNG